MCWCILKVLFASADYFLKWVFLQCSSFWSGPVSCLWNVLYVCYKSMHRVPGGRDLGKGSSLDLCMCFCCWRRRAGGGGMEVWLCKCDCGTGLLCVHGVLIARVHCTPLIWKVHMRSGPAALETIILQTGGQNRILSKRFLSHQWAAAPLQRVANQWDSIQTSLKLLFTFQQ